MLDYHKKACIAVDFVDMYRQLSQLRAQCCGAAYHSSNLMTSPYLTFLHPRQLITENGSPYLQTLSIPARSVSLRKNLRLICSTWSSRVSGFCRTPRAHVIQKLHNRNVANLRTKYDLLSPVVASLLHGQHLKFRQRMSRGLWRRAGNMSFILFPAINLAAVFVYRTAQSQWTVLMPAFICSHKY